MRLYGIPQINDKKLAIASALTYWVFRCRDKQKSPAMGLKTWEFLQSSIKNAAIPAKSLEDYLENLSQKLVVPHLKPREWAWIISPNQRIQRIKESGEILEFDLDQSNQGLIFEGWRSLMASLSSEGITDRHVLATCLKYPHIVTTYVRVRYEEDKAIGFEETPETIEVKANAE